MKKQRLGNVLFWIAGGISIAFIICCFIFRYVAGEEYRETFMADYLADRGYAVGLHVLSIEQQEAFRLAYGKPLSSERVYFEETDTVRVTETYPGIVLHCVELERKVQGKPQPYLRVCDIEVLDARFRFGKQKIGIGSAREEIERAYAKDRDIDTDYLGEEHGNFDADAGYSGGRGRCFLFFYDDRDCVERMIITARTW